MRKKLSIKVCKSLSSIYFYDHQFFMQNLKLKEIFVAISANNKKKRKRRKKSWI